MGLGIKGIKIKIRIRRGDIVPILMEVRRKIMGVGNEYIEWLIL